MMTKYWLLTSCVDLSTAVIEPTKEKYKEFCRGREYGDGWDLTVVEVGLGQLDREGEEVDNAPWNLEMDEENKV